MTEATTAQKSVVVERLCVHHNVAAFSSGESIYDNMVRVAARATSTGTENDAFFVAHHGENVVIGFVAVGDVTIELHPGERVPAVLISGLAVDRSVQSPTPVRALLRRSIAVRNARLPSRPYRYDAAMVPANERVEALLSRSGFVRYNDTFWIRPIA